MESSLTVSLWKTPPRQPWSRTPKHCHCGNPSSKGARLAYISCTCMVNKQPSHPQSGDPSDRWLCPLILDPTWPRNQTLLSRFLITIRCQVQKGFELLLTFIFRFRGKVWQAGTTSRKIQTPWENVRHLTVNSVLGGRGSFVALNIDQDMLE